MKHERFALSTIDDLRTAAELAGIDLPISGNVSVLGEPVDIGALTVPNRFAAQPMEGKDADSSGGPTDLTFRRYERFAGGGSGLIWFEAAAVVPEGRSSPAQLWINRENVESFRTLVSRTRASALATGSGRVVLVLQLTHSGRYSMPEGRPAPMITHNSPVLDPEQGLMADHVPVSDEYLDGLQQKYVEAAELAAYAGFDGVDVKSCHRYLVSELLASFERDGKYGGSFENRTRFLREVIAGICGRVHGIFATTRMNAYDAIEYPYGFGVRQDDRETCDLAEPMALARGLCAAGVPVLSVSIGNPRRDAHHGRPSDSFGRGKKKPQEHPLAGIERFLKITGAIQAVCPEIPVLGGSYGWLRHLMPYVAAGVVSRGWASLAGQGRGMFAYPDSVNDILDSGRMDPGKCCITCSMCAELLGAGARTGCAVRDRDIYGEEYRRRFAAF